MGLEIDWLGEGGRYLVAERPDLLLCELLAFSQCLDIPILRCVRVGGGHSRASKPPLVGFLSFRQCRIPSLRDTLRDS